jgi:hypothetical protein
MDRAIIVDNENRCSYYYPYEVTLEDGELELAIRFANPMMLLYKITKSGTTYIKFDSNKEFYDRVANNITSGKAKLENDGGLTGYKYPIYSIVTREESEFIEQVTISVCALPSYRDGEPDRYRIFIDQGDYHMGCHTYHQKSKIGKRLKALYDAMVKKHAIQEVVPVERKGLGEVLFGEVS